jgi:hypothetical protein
MEQGRATKAQGQRADAAKTDDEHAIGDAPGERNDAERDPAREPAATIARRLTVGQWWTVGTAALSVLGGVAAGAYWLGTRNADPKPPAATPATNVTVSSTSSPRLSQTANPTVIVNSPSASEKTLTSADPGHPTTSASSSPISQSSASPQVPTSSLPLAPETRVGRRKTAPYRVEAVTGSGTDALMAHGELTTRIREALKTLKPTEDVVSISESWVISLDNRMWVSAVILIQ